MPLNFLERVASNLNAFAGNRAFFTSGEHYTYRGLSQRIAAIQKWIQREVAPGCPIGVFSGDGVDTYASILAVLFSGAAYVPIYSKNPIERTREVVASSGLDVILADHDIENQSDLETHCGCRIFDVRELETDLASPTLAPVIDSDLAYLFFTSGSTGKPKGVPISHGNLNTFLGTMLDENWYAFRPSDRFLQMFELTFDLSVTSFLTPLCVGACCYVVPREGVAYMEIFKLLTEQDISVALMVPSVLAYLEPYFDEIQLPAMRYSMFCGEALRSDLAEKWRTCIPGAELQNVYGPTEATIFCTIYPMLEGQSAAEAVNGVAAIGRPMPNVSTYVVSEQGDVVSPGVQGELCLGGSQVTLGYWQDPEKTAEAFRELRVGTVTERVYRTGDLAFVNENGNLVYCGREDAQVKIDGHRVELGEIEFRAREYCGAAPLVAVAAENRAGGLSIHLFVEGEVDEGGLAVHLADRLPSYMLPKRIHAIEQMLFNLNGKMDRNALKARLARD